MHDDQGQLFGSDRNGKGAPSRAALLRAMADGELTGEALERAGRDLDRSLDDRARVEFEKELRQAVGRVMGGAVAPDSLRASIEAIAARSGDASQDAPESGLSIEVPPSLSLTTDPEIEVGPDTAEPVRHGGGRVEAPTRRRTRRVPWGGALAAMLVIGMAGVFIWQAASVGSVPLSTDELGYRTSVVQHVSGEHRRVQDPDVGASKLSLHELQEVRGLFDEVLGAPESLGALIGERGLEDFRAAGNCRVPGADGRSAHMSFEVPAPEGEGTRSLSVFVAPDRGDLPMEVGRTYRIDAAACGEPGATILSWTDGVLAFYMVADLDAADGCLAALSRMGLPGPSGDL